VFTTNLAVAAPVVVSKEHLARSGGIARAVVVNSGCANACTGEAGLGLARDMAEETARTVGCQVEQVLVASTGVIGVHLNAAKVKAGIAAAWPALDRSGHADAARAIMTTDPWPKEAAIRVSAGADIFHVGGMAKGAGMIEPNMATMLGFVTTDARVAPVVLGRALAAATAVTFNAISVDGDTSTNDTVVVLAGGASGVTIDERLYPAFEDALTDICRELARGIVRGGEGATKLVTVHVVGAQSAAEARRAAKTIANSPLVKTAIHGGDPNWGRLVAAAGRAGVAFDPARTRIRIGPAVLFADGQAFPERERLAADHLRAGEVEVEVDLGTGGSDASTVWTCDLSAEYVRINADYRT
jgi:glutamate N-acetyltransferase/amino-acid N-acetyltransferase